MSRKRYAILAAIGAASVAALAAAGATLVPKRFQRRSRLRKAADVLTTLVR